MIRKYQRRDALFYYLRFQCHYQSRTPAIIMIRLSNHSSGSSRLIEQNINLNTFVLLKACERTHPTKVSIIINLIRITIFSSSSLTRRYI
jgi:hypothetical protein